MQPIKAKAYAKINLALKVLGKRPDGYHTIETILQNVDLADVLTLQEAHDLTIEGDCPVKLHENLVFKAAQLLKTNYRVEKGVAISLKKNIPLKAGLGGGSADAAVTLLALNKLWQLNLSKKELCQTGALIGSDVNFFLQGGLALAEGRGEKVTALEGHLELDLVIAKPKFGITAKEAYELWNRQKAKSDADIGPIIAKIRKSELDERTLFNDLQEGVMQNWPPYKELFKAGYEAGAKLVMLSGSGSAFFAIVRNAVAQDSVYNVWSELKELSVFKVKTINRSVEFES